MTGLNEGDMEKLSADAINNHMSELSLKAAPDSAKALLNRAKSLYRSVRSHTQSEDFHAYECTQTKYGMTHNKVFQS